MCGEPEGSASAKRSNNRTDLLEYLVSRLASLVVDELNHLAHIATRLLHFLLIKLGLAPNRCNLAAYLPPVLIHTLGCHQSDLDSRIQREGVKILLTPLPLVYA